MRIGSISVVVVFSSFLLFFSGGPGGLSPPEGRFPPPTPDMFTSPTRDQTWYATYVSTTLKKLPMFSNSHSFDVSWLLLKGSSTDFIASEY